MGKKDVEIIKLIPQGNYAVLIQFDDGHDTGIFTWEYLISASNPNLLNRPHYPSSDLGQNLNQVTQKYYEALQTAGLSRERYVRKVTNLDRE